MVSLKFAYGDRIVIAKAITYFTDFINLSLESGHPKQDIDIVPYASKPSLSILQCRSIREFTIKSNRTLASFLDACSALPR